CIKSHRDEIVEDPGVWPDLGTGKFGQLRGSKSIFGCSPGIAKSPELLKKKILQSCPGRGDPGGRGFDRFRSPDVATCDRPLSTAERLLKQDLQFLPVVTEDHVVYAYVVQVVPLMREYVVYQCICHRRI